MLKTKKLIKLMASESLLAIINRYTRSIKVPHQWILSIATFFSSITFVVMVFNLPFYNWKISNLIIK